MTVAPGRANGAQPASAMSPIAWTPSKDMDVVAWVKVGHKLGSMSRCSRWWLGDWIRFGITRWGEKYKETARITGYDIKTLRNIAYVAEHVEASRRRDNLSWSHHAEVCPLEPDTQDRWLDLVATQGLSIADLRTELRAARRANGESATRPEPEAATVTCPECEHRFEIPVL